MGAVGGGVIRIGRWEIGELQKVYRSFEVREL